MTTTVKMDIPAADYLPSLCVASGCLNDPVPGKRHCRRHEASREAQRQELEERQAAAVRRRFNRIAPKLRTQLYAIEIIESQLVKFGVSAKPRDRMWHLQTASPVPLRLVAHVGCDRLLERDVHEYCAEQRIRGEWFQRSGRAATIEHLIVEGNAMAIYDLIGRRPPWALT